MMALKAREMFGERELAVGVELLSADVPVSRFAEL
jgi:hypothetical protein